MGELLALSAALCFGTTHFVNGLASRRANGITVALHAQLAGTVLVSIAALLVPVGHPTWAAVGWGALSGLGSGIGVAFLYRAMSHGAMSVVVPVSDVGAVALPVLVGVALLGERPAPLALLGIVVAFPAIWLVSRTGRHGADPPVSRRRFAPGVVSALAAGIGFAVQFLAMAQVPAGTGLRPIVASRIASVIVIAPVLLVTRVPWRLSPRWWAMTVAAGGVGTLAILLYLAATHHQLLAVATVLAALYPAIPVLLAVVFLPERLARVQMVGLVCAGTAIALLAIA